MISISKLMFFITAATSVSVWAATPKVATEPKKTETTLESELSSLEVSNKVPSNISKEKLYSIQLRSVSLVKRSEVNLGWGQNLSSNSFLKSQQLDVKYMFHFNDKWALGLGYSQVYNEFTDSARRLADIQGVYPDLDFAKSRAEITAEYNIFYGKFRFTQDQAFYFDNYFALGMASSQLGSGTAQGPVADLGFAFWLSRWGSLRLGLKDYAYSEKRALTSGSANYVNGYVKMGYLF